MSGKNELFFRFNPPLPYFFVCNGAQNKGGELIEKDRGSHQTIEAGGS